MSLQKTPNRPTAYIKSKAPQTKKGKAGLVILLCFMFLCICCVASVGIFVTGVGLVEKMGNALEGHFQSSDVTEVADGEAVRDPLVELSSDGSDTVTVMVYMNGSTLESEGGEATADLYEMIKAGTSSKVNVIVQTMGTRRWEKTYGIASNRSQIYKLDGSGMHLIKDDLGQLDCTSASTLRDFVSWTAKNYPAQRNILLFWDHGGGPVYGFGYDEWQDEGAALTIDEIQSALGNAGVKFDFIGMDCCIMSCLEVCCALYDYCDYMVLSEDFESGLGWNYTSWLKALYNNTGISTPDLAKIIIDDMVKTNESDRQNGSDAILACIDESMMKVLFTAWTDFAYANESALLGNNYSQQVTRSGRALPARYDWFSYWLDDGYTDASMDDYYITDIMALAQTINSDESAALSSALKKAIVYMNATSSDSHLTGLSVTLPYGDKTFYRSLKTIFSNCGFDEAYIEWLSKFTSASGSSSFYDYGSWDSSWGGWDSYTDDYDWYNWDYYNSSDWDSNWYGGSSGWGSSSWGSSGWGSSLLDYTLDWLSGNMSYDSGYSGYSSGWGW